MTRSDRTTRAGHDCRRSGLAWFVGLLLCCTGSASAESWIAATHGGALGNPGGRHGINVGGLVPARGQDIALFSLLQPGPGEITAFSADIRLVAVGPVEIDADPGLAYVTLQVGNSGPAAVADAVLTASASPQPESISWLCMNNPGQCPAFGAGRTVPGIVLNPGESVVIEYTLEFAALSDFQLTALVNSELDDPLALDNILTLTFSDLVFSAGFE